MLIRSWSSGFRLITADPHSAQKSFSQPPPSGRQAFSASSPETSRKLPGSGRALAEAAVPLRRRQRLQWQ